MNIKNKTSKSIDTHNFTQEIPIGSFSEQTSKNKVSVIVAAFNSAHEIECTINSFVNQSYQKKELIIIDGGSTDGTLELIKRYENKIDFWISEPDRGIADAFNKGVTLAKGDFIYFIGAGDFFWKSNVLEKVMEGVDSKIDMLVCGRINRTTEDGKTVLYTSSLNFKKWMLLYKMGLPHQGLFTNKIFFDKYGLFDLKYKFAMDYELLLRAYKEFPDVVMKDVIVAAWRDGGVGKGRILEVLEEFRKIKIKNKIAPTLIINLITLASKIKYLLDRLLK